MPTELEELVSFLHSPQPAVVQIALNNLVGYSSGSQKSIFHADNYRAITDLKQISKKNEKTAVTESMTILANLCDNIEVRNLIVEDTVYFKYLVQQVINLNNTNVDLTTILIVNLSKSDHILKIFDFELELNDEQKKFFSSSSAIDCLMDCFVKGYDRKLNEYANYDYLGYLFSDLASHRVGREYFLSPQSYDNVVPLSKILVFTEKYDSKTRREGVVSTIKNTLFDQQSHIKLMTDPDINLLPYILLPLAGPEEFEDDEMFTLPDELQLLPADKKREPVADILTIYLECIMLICTTKPGREHLRGKSVYPIIRELHKNVIQNDKQADLCERIVQMLMRDEAPKEEEQEESEGEDQIVEVL